LSLDSGKQTGQQDQKEGFTQRVNCFHQELELATL
jgi:hypothetical protein